MGGSVRRHQGRPPHRELRRVGGGTGNSGKGQETADQPPASDESLVSKREEKNANPSTSATVPTVNNSSGSGNGKRAPSTVQQQQQQQPAAPRYPPREVPPRFRQHEHKQLLKRGQPLPAGTLPLTSASAQPGAPSPPRTPAAAGFSQNSSKRHTDRPSIPPSACPGDSRVGAARGQKVPGTRAEVLDTK
ncbi:hypothetical protein JZ751_026819, partial [Albula glossodonta]